MGMEDTIRRFPEQFDWQPEVVHAGALKQYKYFIVCGMGGSQLASSLIQTYGPASNIIIHRDYGLPNVAPDILKDALIILSSYSGTTEETLDSGRQALARALPAAAISTGGALIPWAQQNGLPHVVMPDMQLQPRLATGLSLLGMAHLMGMNDIEAAIRAAGKAMDPMAGQEEGKRLADTLHDKVPLVYSSAANAPLAYIWKIKLNETAKTPAFYNLLPEMCHNELCGMDVADSTRPLSANMLALFLEDDSDHPRNKKRMQIARDMLQERGIPAQSLPLSGAGFEKVLRSSLLVDWVSLNLAEMYGVPDEATPLIADFKERMAK